jgi:hypothetical protein
MSEDNKLNMLEDKINLKKVLVRMDVKYFLTNDPPSPFKGWNLPAFQEYCRRELSEVGFDFDRKIHAYYSRQSGEIVFWQNVLELNFTEANLN